MNAPVCPHCKNEINFLIALKIGNPFYFKCPLCKVLIKQFSIPLFFIAITATLFAIGCFVWIVSQLLSGTLQGIALSISVLTFGLLLIERLTYWYLSKNGVLKNNKTMVLHGMLPTREPNVIKRNMKKRPSKFIKDQLRKPKTEQSWVVRFLVQITSSEILLVFLVTILVSAYYLAQASNFIAKSSMKESIRLISSLILIGVFLGVIVVTDDSEKYRKSGARIRTICGVVTSTALCILFNAPFELYPVFIFIGAILGCTGMIWAQFF